MKLRPFAFALLLVLAAPAGAELPPVRGIVWQLYEGAPTPAADYERLGVREVLLQWSAVDGIAFVPGSGLREADAMPDWARIAREPWAQSFIVGLSGRFDEAESRRELAQLASESERLARLNFPFRVAGFYFPAEVDPEWQDPSVLRPLLARLPRPLWISVYDSDDIGPERFARWVRRWLPRDVGIFFQDGVGVGARIPTRARAYADALRRRLGSRRVRIIAEAFRQAPDGTFRPATAGELRPQIEALRGYQIYLFDGPHYVDDRLIDELQISSNRQQSR